MHFEFWNDYRVDAILTRQILSLIEYNKLSKLHNTWFGPSFWDTNLTLYQARTILFHSWALLMIVTYTNLTLHQWNSAYWWSMQDHMILWWRACVGPFIIAQLRSYRSSVGDNQIQMHASLTGNWIKCIGYAKPITKQWWKNTFKDISKRT